MTKTADIDWVKAERFYRAGVLTDERIAEKCGCSRQAITKKAKQQGWTRNLQSSIRKVAKRKLLESSQSSGALKASEPDKQSSTPPNVSTPVAAPDVHAREEEALAEAAAYFPTRERLDEALVEAAAREIVMVTQAHRVEAARLMGIARDLGGKLVELIEGRATGFEVDVKDGSKKVRLSFLGEHESVSDALGKVTRALKHLVDIERKAFGMDEEVDNPDGSRRDFVPLEERLATYRREDAMAEAGNVVKLPAPASTPIGTELVKPPAGGPTIEEDKEAKMSDLNMYGKIARDYLEEHSPDEFKRLQRKGQLNAHLIKVQNRVSDLVQVTYEGILERNPLPDDQMGIFRAIQTAWNQAQEITLSQEFPPRLPPEERQEGPPEAGPPDALIET